MPVLSRVLSQLKPRSLTQEPAPGEISPLPQGCIAAIPVSMSLALCRKLSSMSLMGETGQLTAFQAHLSAGTKGEQWLPPPPHQYLEGRDLIFSTLPQTLCHPENIYIHFKNRNQETQGVGQFCLCH